MCEVCEKLAAKESVDAESVSMIIASLLETLLELGDKVHSHTAAGCTGICLVEMLEGVVGELQDWPALLHHNLMALDREAARQRRRISNSN